MKKEIYKISFVVLVAIFLFVFISHARNTPHPLITYPSTVVTTTSKTDVVPQAEFTLDRVVDGDTVVIKTASSTTLKVRILGINSPESVDPRKPVECFGKEASEHLQNLLPKGSAVHLILDKSQGETDKYGRLLRYVEIGTSTDIGLSMIRDGFAYQYLYKHPYDRYRVYVEAEKNAKAKKVGLWGAGCR